MPHHTYTTPTPVSQHATSTGDVLAAAIEKLGRTGITNPAQFAHLGADSILGTLAWFEAQKGRVGVGVLVNELRAGGKAGWRPVGAVVDEQRAYGEQVCAWLNRHFPEFQEPCGRPHHAAIVMVLHLHQLVGRGRLTVGEHGGEIRAAVRAWREKWDSTEGEG